MSGSRATNDDSLSQPKSTSDDVDVKEAETRVLPPEKAVPAEVADARARRADLGHLDRVVCRWNKPRYVILLNVATSELPAELITFI